MNQPRTEEFAQFDRLLRKEAPDGYTPHYFRCRQGGKAPDTSYGSWKADSARLTAAEAIAWLESGGNVGVAGMEDDRLVNVDIDDEDETSLGDLKPTLVSRSRSRTGGHGFYFAEPDEDIPNIPTDDAGEVRTDGQFVVAPGSYVAVDEPDAVPDDEKGDAGYYTVEQRNPAAPITFDELPAVFREIHERNEKLRDQATKRTEEFDIPDTPGGRSAVFDVSASDVTAKEGGSIDTNDRWSSVFHGSETDENMALTSKGRLQCFRHNVAHGGLQALVVMSDYIANGDRACERVGTPHSNSGGSPPCIVGDDEAIWCAWKYAKQNGYTPDDDPVPYRALLHLVRDMGVAPEDKIPDEYDPENGKQLPGYAYDAALSTIENRHGLDAGRKKTHEISRAAGGPDVSAAKEAQNQTGGGEKDAGNGRGGASESSTDTDAGTDADDGSEDTGTSFEDRIYSEVITPLDPPDGYEGTTIDQNVAVQRAAEIFDDEMAFVRPREATRGWRDCLYIYADGEHIGRTDDIGIFEPDAKAELNRIGERLFGAVANDAFVREFTNKVERRNRVRARKLRPDEHRLVVNNGVLDLTTGELDAHTPDEYHRTKVEHDYDPDAECPAIDEFLHEIVAEDDVPTLYRFIAHALYKGYPEAKAAMLLGDGANGKSMFLSLVEEFLGEFNVSGRSLQDITEYRWAANDLVGKLANVHADMSDQDVDSMRMFKNLTGEDTVDADVKYEKPIKFTNHATMLFACNEMPVLKDDTQGNWRRWVLIDFPNTFDSDDPSANDAKARSTLEAELFDEAELEGLLARCVEEIQAWHGGRAWFPDVPGWRDTRSKMRRAAEPVFDFAEACLVTDDESWTTKSDIRDAYREYATREGLPKMEREIFGRKLHMLADYNVEAGEKRDPDGPRRLKVYKNIELNARGAALIGGGDFDPREAVLQVVRGEDGRVPEALVIERLHDEYGIDNGRGEHALDKLKKNGTLLLSKAHGVEWVEVT